MPRDSSVFTCSSRASPRNKTMQHAPSYKTENRRQVHESLHHISTCLAYPRQIKYKNIRQH
uniref:Uncharacterized protein n=1 Tax=Arundo donax TaxID=35708 RepID=A0A0A9FC24_ARUDO